MTDNNCQNELDITKRKLAELEATLAAYKPIVQIYLQARGIEEKEIRDGSLYLRWVLLLDRIGNRIRGLII